MDELAAIESYRWNALGGHDPTIIQDNSTGKYFSFSTDSVVDGKYTSGIQIRVSGDLIHWEYLGLAFEGVPDEAYEWAQAEGLWAPEVIRYEDSYRMYYSASTFGSTTSCIGLATASELAGPWEHKAIVIKTNSEIAGHNAIDANIVMDREGMMWLCYGSFFGGIFLVQLDADTGLPLIKGDFGKCIAKRDATVDTAIEGAFIFYNQEWDYYYLFTSYDSLFDTYNVRVARSKNIEGPYIDHLANDILQEHDLPNNVGTKIVGSYQFDGDVAWMAPGHNSIFLEPSSNKTYMVHHVRIASNLHQHLTFIRSIHWLKNGWPVVSPEYVSEIEMENTTLTLAPALMVGEWAIVHFSQTNNKLEQAKQKYFSTDTIQHMQNLGSGNYYDALDKSYFRIWKGFGWKESSPEWHIAGMSAEGTLFFGKKVQK